MTACAPPPLPLLQTVAERYAIKSFELTSETDR